jgi:hypothetical protein
MFKFLKYNIYVKISKSWDGWDSACERCNVWESEGNSIITVDLDGGSQKRTCGNCGYIWRSNFTPAGFINIGDFEE